MLMSYPESILEVVEALESHALTEGPHVEFKLFYRSVNYDALVRIMIGFANSDGGVIIIGIDELYDSSLMEAVYRCQEIPRAIKDEFEDKLASFISHRTANLDNWSFKTGLFFGHEFGVLFVHPSEKGMCFIHSESDRLNRTYYYRQGSKNVSVRAQFRRVFKYMSLENAIISLESKKWRFFEPTKWSDKFEGRFYRANYEHITKDDKNVQRVYATCVTRTQNSEAAWKVYAGSEGLQSHCIQLELDLGSLYDQLFASGFKIFERKVEYIREPQLLHIHESGNSFHELYFSDFNFRRYLDLLALKREAYSYENEVRYFAIPQKPEGRKLAGKALSEDLVIDWKEVILGIRVDKKCSLSELLALRHSCWSCGIDPVIKGQKLPGKRIPEADKMKKIDVILFNIDDMPGRRRITIDPC